jgi:hypothetical protein
MNALGIYIGMPHRHRFFFDHAQPALLGAET